MDKIKIFVSDLHIAPEDYHDHFESQNEFIEFLDDLDKENNNIELVLLGDIFDLVRAGLDYKNPLVKLMQNPRYKRFFKRLKEFATKHDVYFVIGNHDAAACWNKEVQKTLKELNIKFHKDQVLYYDHTYTADKKKFYVYAEHGNQLEELSRFRDVYNPLDTPVSHTINTFAVGRIEKFAMKTKNAWLKDISIIKPWEKVFTWFYSKYFYYELNRPLRYVFLPLFAGFFAAKLLLLFLMIYFIVLKKSIPISPVFFPFVVLVMVFLILDFSVFVVGILWHLIKSDFRKNWQKYDIPFNFNFNKSLWAGTRAKIIKILKNSGEKLYGNPKDPDLFVLGHYHEPHMDTIKIGKSLKGWVDIGSWRKNILRVEANFKLPAVYLPIYNLTYLKLYQDKDKVIAELRHRYKEWTYKPTLLEKIAIYKKWKPPVPDGKDNLLQTRIFYLREPVAQLG